MEEKIKLNFVESKKVILEKFETSNKEPMNLFDPPFYFFMSVFVAVILYSFISLAFMFIIKSSI